jgi:predicted RNase H-like nuclease
VTHAYVGIDGCRGNKWFCVELGRDDAWNCSILAVDGIGQIANSAQIVLIDIPIGLVDSGAEERACDREARRLLAPKRASSVFPAPARATLQARGYADAVKINQRLTGRGISKQSWAIAPRIRAIDGLLQVDAKLRGLLRECHPEVCFWALNGGTPMAHSKKTAEGRSERMAVLRRFFPAADELFEKAVTSHLRRDVALDDIIDAMVAAVTAKIGDGRYRTLPVHSPRDATGLPMEMVYCLP